MARASLKEKISESAVDRLRAKGFAGCSVQDITDGAGAPKGSFYNHFQSKEHVAVEALARYIAEQDAASLLDRTVPPLVRLRGFFERMAMRLEDGAFRQGCLMGTLSADVQDDYPLVRDAVGATYVEFTRAVETVLVEAQADGTIAVRFDANVMATVVVDAWEGAVLRMKVERSGASLHAFLSIVFDHMLAAS